VDVNLFGLGINSNDVLPFLGSDFHMPFKWALGEGAADHRNPALSITETPQFLSGAASRQ